jgi:hypothetical protein
MLLRRWIVRWRMRRGRVISISIHIVSFRRGSVQIHELSCLSFILIFVFMLMIWVYANKLLLLHPIPSQSVKCNFQKIRPKVVPVCPHTPMLCKTNKQAKNPGADSAPNCGRTATIHDVKISRTKHMPFQSRPSHAMSFARRQTRRAAGCACSA